MFGREKEQEDYWEISKDLYTYGIFSDDTQNQLKIIIIGAKKMIMIKKKTITKLICNCLLFVCRAWHITRW